MIRDKSRKVAFLEVHLLSSCVAERQHSIPPHHNTDADGGLKQHLPMKDFLPVFMFSLDSDYTGCQARGSLMNERLSAAQRPGD